MKFKRIKVVSGRAGVQVTGYAYAAGGREIVIGSFACTKQELKARMADPLMQKRVGLDLQASRQIPGVLDN